MSIAIGRRNGGHLLAFGMSVLHDHVVKISPQVRGSNYTFTRLSWGDPLFHLAEGYAILAGIRSAFLATSICPELLVCVI